MTRHNFDIWLKEEFDVYKSEVGRGSRAILKWIADLDNRLTKLEEKLNDKQKH